MIETPPQEIIETYREWLSHWAALRQRIFQIDLLNSGMWGNVYPQDVNTVSLPFVENLFRMTIEDTGYLFNELEPTERVPMSGEKDRTGAEERERALVGYNNRSPLNEDRGLSGMDMVAAGFTAIKTWPEFGREPTKRFPVFTRLDPRRVLPEPGAGPGRPTDAVIVHSRQSVKKLLRQYPEQVGPLIRRIADSRKSMPSASNGYRIPSSEDADETKELTSIDYWSTDYACTIALYDPMGNGSGSDMEVLGQWVNPTGICPIQLAFRPTWSQEPLGQLDDSKGIVRAKNRFYRILFDYFTRMVYGGKLAWNVANPRDRGPDVTYEALGPDAKMDTVTPDNPSFQMWAALDRLDDAARGGMVAPRSRQGDVELNKATAAFLTRAQGQLRSVVSGLQGRYAIAKRHANEAAFAQDEFFCNVTKEVNGVARGRRFALTYKPSDLINGDFANIVKYGTSSGLDKPTDNVLRIEKLQAGAISMTDFLEQDPDTEDVEVAQARIYLGEIVKGMLGSLNQPGADLEETAMALTAFAKDSDIVAVAEQILEHRKQKAAQAAGPMPGISELGGPQGLGGPPGQPGGAPAGEVGAVVPGVGPARALPDLSTVRHLIARGR